MVSPSSFIELQILFEVIHSELSHSVQRSWTTLIKGPCTILICHSHVLSSEAADGGISVSTTVKEYFRIMRRIAQKHVLRI